ncbi:hypothetical protein [Falsirhodobacter algicola]|nr:hypothetical protein [Falsirhodobacter algicola]
MMPNQHELMIAAQRERTLYLASLLRAAVRKFKSLGLRKATPKAI